MRQWGVSALESDGEFLWWLGRFVGTWRIDDGTYVVSRGRGGWLEARAFPSCARVPLETALETGRRTEEAGPLGPPPVLVSEQLMDVWLTPEDLRRLRGAMHVSRGLDLIVATIEQRMAEVDESEQKRRWLLYWSSARTERPAKQEAGYITRLREACRAETAPSKE